MIVGINATKLIKIPQNSKNKWPHADMVNIISFKICEYEFFSYLCPMAQQTGP